MAVRLAVHLDGCYLDDQTDGGVGHHSRMEVCSHYPSWQCDTDHHHPDQMGYYSTDTVAEAEGRRASASPVGALVSVFGLEEDHNQGQLDEYEREQEGRWE